METLEFTSVLGPSYQGELERLLFFNQNQRKAQENLPLLIGRYGMARVTVADGRLRVVLESSPPPQVLYVLDRSDTGPRLVGVSVYLREADTLSLVIVAVAEDYAGAAADGEQPLVKKIVRAMCDVARRIHGVTSVTLFPATPNEKKLSLA